MSKIQEQAMLIFTDSVNNNNKFYELTLFETGDVQARWGRVGVAGTITPYAGGGLKKYQSLLTAKLAKGYERSKIVANVDPLKAVSTTALADTAKRDMLTAGTVTAKEQSVLESLLEKLSSMNRHQIMAASSGNITVDASGLVSTPLGLVTAATIKSARDILVKLEKLVSKKTFDAKYADHLNAYLKLIPQKVGAKKGWHEVFFSEHTNFVKQNDLLDQLEGSIKLYESKKEQALKQGSASAPADELFKTKLTLVTDPAVLKKIKDFYAKSVNSQHVSSKLKLKNVYEVSNPEWEQRFSEKAKKVGNVQQLWHGTRAHNILSIFKVGLIVPKSGGSYTITGRMFGDGVYFSDQSSKSLNYSYGYWDGGPKDSTCFMFLADVAMGKSYTPSSPTQSLPRGYNSMFAKANQSGVRNNEMIVYDTNQANLRYLCEFSE